MFSASVASVAQIVPPDFVICEAELKSVLSFIANSHEQSKTTFIDNVVDFIDNVVDPVDLAIDQLYDHAL